MGLIFFTAVLGGLAAWRPWARRKGTGRPPDDDANAEHVDTEIPSWRWRPESWRTMFGFRKATPRQTYQLTYADPYGTVSERVIASPRGCMLDGALYVDAWCSRRGERRTFRATRIVELVDTAGKRIENPQSYFAVGATPRDRKKRPETFDGHERAMREISASLITLIWIARTDTDVDARELSLLLEYADRHLAMSNSMSAIDPRRLAVWIDDRAPTMTTALFSSVQLNSGERHERLLYEYAQKLIRSSGTPNSAKIERLDQLIAAL